MSPGDAGGSERLPLELEAESPRPAPDKGDTEVELSIVVLLEERGRSADEMFREYAPQLRDLGRTFEFVFIAGPRLADRAVSVSKPSDVRDGKLRVLQVGQPVGQSSLLKMAVGHCRGEIIVTLPPSFRVLPDALPELIQRFDSGCDSGCDVAVARRWPRRDSLLNRIQSGFCSWLLNVLTGSRFHDITCRVSALRRKVLEEIPLYGGYFRFLPIVAAREGFRVEEVSVRPHPGGGRARVYRPGVYLGWLIDILGIFFLLSFTYRPLRFFGSVGAAFGSLGAVILVVLLIQRLGGQGIANRPMLLLGVLLVTLGVQAVALGLIGEIVVYFQATRAATYRLARPDRTEDS